MGKVISVGIVALGKASELAYPLVAAMAVNKYYKFDTYLRIATAALGTITVAIFAFLGRLSDIGSLFAVIYQLLWFVPPAFTLLKLKKKKN